MTASSVDRRTLFALATAASTLAAAPALARSRSADLNDPEQNLRAYIRMRGDLTGKTVVERVEARTFGVIEHKLPAPLFAAVGIQVSRFLPSAEGFLFRYKYFSLTTDLATGAPMAALANPYTGKSNAIPPRVTEPGEILLTTRGWQFTRKPNDAATQTNPGVVRPWARMGDQLQLTDTLISPPKFEVHPAFQLFTYMSPFALATDMRRASVPASFAGTGMEDWRDWMEMDSKVHDGSLTVHMTGRKVSGRADFPDWLLAAADKQMPNLFDSF
jgi:Protein of unknown function (DUF1838)